MPLLISSLILRELGGGQVDLAILKKRKEWQAILYEIKSSGHLSRKQYERLKKSGQLIGAIFSCISLIRVVGPEEMGIAKDGKLI